ncbi:MAG: dTDP-glucose 4,6-dehydratase [Verrucomicrobia bacterium]|nr:dTDP-glucose 4,6-dehydratase [Verrucomicrobiota bacterium]
MLENKKILVTGGAGFMGSDFIKMVLSEKAFSGEIVNLDLLTYAGNLENLREVSNDPRYSFVRGDVCNRELIENLFMHTKFDVIVHFAAETHVDRSIDQPKTFIETNIVGTYTLLEALRSHKDSYLHLISTDEVYGDLPKEGVFTERSPYAPSSPYAASKASADHLAMSYARTYNLKVTISHASNNYGPRQHPEKLIPRMIERCLTGEDLTVYGSGAQVRDWLFVRDHSEAIWSILAKGKKGQVYNVGGGHEMTNLEVIHEIIDKFSSLKGVDPNLYRNRIIHVRDRPGHDFRYAMDISKICKETGWEPKVGFTDGLMRTIEERVV